MMLTPAQQEQSVLRAMLAEGQTPTEIKRQFPRLSWTLDELFDLQKAVEAEIAA
jgi:hypothetical protein